MTRQDQFIPQLIVNGGTAAMDFYASAFGAVEVSRTMAGDSTRLVHGELSIEGHKFYVSDEFPESEGGSCKSPQTLGGTSVRITLYVDDVDAVATRATAAGARVLMPVQDMFWGGRYGKLVDPFGHEWGINQETRVQTEAETQSGADEYFKARP